MMPVLKNRFATPKEPQNGVAISPCQGTPQFLESLKHHASAGTEKPLQLVSAT